jgi:hypothetical protein
MRYIVALLVICFTIGLTAAVMAEESPAKYAGAENCKMCHPDIAADWAKSRHAKAFDLLVNVGQEKNAKCLTCHATGYGKGGFTDTASTADLQGVTCEACHGAGADHNGDKSKIVRVPAVTTCAGCHQKLNIHGIPDEAK